MNKHVKGAYNVAAIVGVGKIYWEIAWISGFVFAFHWCFA